jgi:hypothetical protein
MPKAKKPKWTAVLSDPNRDAILRDNTTTGSWRGFPNYCCNLCPAAYIDPNAAVDHFIASHAPPVEEVHIINTGLVDADGSAITRAEPKEEPK